MLRKMLGKQQQLNSKYEYRDISKRSTDRLYFTPGIYVCVYHCILLNGEATQGSTSKIGKQNCFGTSRHVATSAICKQLVKPEASHLNT